MDGLNNNGGGAPWWVVWQGLAGTIGLGLWGFVRWWRERRDKLHLESMTREERLSRDIELMRSNAAKDASDVFSRVQGELARKDQQNEKQDLRIDKLEGDLSIWVDRARSWEQRAHEIMHRLNNARMSINALRIRAGLPEVAWPGETLPRLEDIRAGNEAYFNRKALDGAEGLGPEEQKP